MLLRKNYKIIYKMKKVLLTSSLLASIVFGAQAQWTEQVTNLDADKLVSDLKVVNTQTVWLVGQSLAPGAGQTGPAYQSGSITTNGGGLWTKFNVTFSGSTTYDFSNISALDDKTAYVAMYKTGGGGAIVKTTNGGVTWQKTTTSTQFAGPTGFPNNVHMFSAKDGVAMGDPVGGYYEIYTTSDSGKTWVRTPDTGGQLTAQQGKEYGTVRLYDEMNGTIWFATNPADTLQPAGGKVFKSTDKGFTWTSATTPFGKGIAHIAFTDATHGLVMNYNGKQLMSTTDGGATWTDVTTTGDFYTFDLVRVPYRPGMYVTCGLLADQSAYARSISPDNGQTWFPMPNDADLAASGFTRMEFLGDDYAFAGGYTNNSQGGVFKLSSKLASIAAIKNVKENVLVYPNPSNSGVFYMNTASATNVQVSDVTGKVVYTANNETAGNGIKVDLSSMGKGLYIMKVTSGKATTTQKLVVE